MEVADIGTEWLNPQRLITPVTAALVVAVAVATAQLTWRLVPAPQPTSEPPAPAGQTLQTGDAGNGGNSELVGDWQLFGRADPLDGEDDQRIDAPETQLDLQLQGIFYSQDDDRAYALITDGRDGTAAYRVGDGLAGGGEIEAIYEDRVILDRNGNYEALPLPGDRVPLGEALADSEPATPSEPAQPAGQTQPDDPAGGGGRTDGAPAEYRQQLADDPQQLAEHIQMQPAVEDGEMVGMAIGPGQDGALFEQLDLQDGDVITAIDGTDARNPGEAMQALQQAGQDGGAIELRVRRGGSQQTIQIDLD